jgi:hypothetical protein
VGRERDVLRCCARTSGERNVLLYIEGTHGWWGFHYR